MRTIFLFLKKNVKYYFVYISLYITHCITSAKFLLYNKILESVGLISWNDTIIYWTILALIINLFAMKDFALQLAGNKKISILCYLSGCCIISLVWFWLSVFPGFYIYIYFGGVLQ